MSNEEIPWPFKDMQVRFTDCQTKKMAHIHEEEFLRPDVVEIHKRDAESVAVHNLFGKGLTLLKTQWLPNIEHGGADLHVTFGKMT